MKTLGTTPDGNYIVEMTLQEQNAFDKLGKASKGLGGAWQPFRETRNIDADLTDALCLVLLWTESKFRLNELEHAIADVKDLIGHWRQPGE